MAIDPNLLVIKPVSELQTVTGLQDGKLLFYDTTDPNLPLKVITIDTFNNLSKTAKPLSPTDPTPSVEGLYIPTESGTYTNAGGLVAEVGYYTLFFFDGTDWTKSETLLPDNSEQIEGVIEEGIVETEIVKGSNQIRARSSTFASWGQRVTGIEQINSIKYIVDPYDSSMVPTYVRLIIRNSNTGVILVDKTVTHAFVYNVPEEIQINLDIIFENPTLIPLQISFVTDGYNAGRGQVATIPNVEDRAMYSTTPGSEFVDIPASPSFFLYMKIISESLENVLTDKAVEQVREALKPVQQSLINSTVFLMPGLEYNIFNKNAILGYSDKIKYNSTKGKQLKRNFQYLALASEEFSVNVVDNDSYIQDIKVAAASSGSGVNRKITEISDSTGDVAKIMTPLLANFASDSMNLTSLGTLEYNGVKYEGRGGWKISDYYGIGRILYRFNVTGVSVNPTIGSVYSISGVNYTVTEINMTGGTGYFSCTGASSPPASGTLTKISGTGDSSIAYGSSQTLSANPFYNPATEKFDLAYYMSQTSQSMIAGDWFSFRLGINDIVQMKTQAQSDAEIPELLSMLDEMITSVKAYNSGIRIAISLLQPPADQNAWGLNYGCEYDYETYVNVGLRSFQLALINAYDNGVSRASNIHLIATHLNLDVDYNLETTEQKPNARSEDYIVMQGNAVHPADTGNMQIADMLSGPIKYFG